jgi:hemerythrin superfamily protein
MGEHKFFTHLREDHDEQKKIGRQLSEAKTPQERDQLRKKLYDSLHPHMLGEEASIFSRLKAAEDEEVRDDALEGLQEHHVGKIVLRELMEMQTGSDEFKAKAKVLDEMNRHHIEEEEDDVFSHLKKLCTDQELSDLFEKYENAEENAK